jgi:hypothetical protein
MGHANASTRRKRLERRQGLAQAALSQNGAYDIVAHTPTCPCAACEARRTEKLRGGIEQTRSRRRTYEPGHAQPEHRAGWNAAAQHTILADWIKTHRVDMDARMHVTALDLKPSFVAHLDAAVSLDAEDLDAGLLYRALIIMHRVHPLRARIIDACAIAGRTRDDVGDSEHMSPQAVSKNLGCGLELLLDLYGGLVLAEQCDVAQPAVP